MGGVVNLSTDTNGTYISCFVEPPLNLSHRITNMLPEINLEGGDSF